ncbi:hypothetical protein GCM10023142_24270 [Anaerocolumna aminovalerica]
MDLKIRFRLRMYIWKYWKLPNTRMPRLIQLGINRNWAKCTTYSLKGYARLCSGGAVAVAINNKRLTQYGLVSMLDYYSKQPC